MSHLAAVSHLAMSKRARSDDERAAGNASKKQARLNAVDDELEASLECPVCLLTSFPPVRQCPNGHVICDACSKRCPKCPTCRSEPTSIRNLMVEKIAQRQKWPCRFADAGCHTLLDFSVAANAHFGKCEYRAQKCCAFPGCGVEMTLHASTVVQHLTNEHNMEVESWLDINTKIGHAMVYVLGKSDLKSTRGFADNYLISHHDAHFLFVISDSDTHLNFSITRLGMRNEVDGLEVVVRFEDKHKRQHEHREPIICLQERCQRIDAGICSVLDSYDGSLQMRKALVWEDFAEDCSASAVGKHRTGNMRFFQFSIAIRKAVI